MTEADQSRAAGQLVPRAHQRRAIDAVLQAFGRTDRATIVMPCGSGKTLVELEVAGRYSRVLILEPSLALIAQSLAAARHQGTTGERLVLCVCSDRSVASSDEWRVGPSELGVPVTTDPVAIREALSRNGRHLVYCTYQSISLLMDALPARYRFDCAIFDEAHRTAGARDRLFSRSLSDDLPARRRLFATATPKHTAFRGANRTEGDDALVYSMENTAVYGEVVYRMSLSDAVESGICSDYEVLISACSGTEARRAIQRGRELHAAQPDSSVEEVALQIALARAAAQSGARRMITFHRNVEDAVSFAEDRGRLLEAEGITSLHVNGAMDAASRNEIIRAFVECEHRAVLTNAKCLTEGIDVPSVDLVGFMTTKRSQFEIVQAVGRALRVHPGKARGFILLPVFLDAANEDEEALATQIDRTDFAVTWDVMHTILESDGALADRIAVARRALGHEGAGAVRRVARLRVVADESVVASLEQSITVMAVRQLSARWDETYGIAKGYYERTGSLDVPKSHKERGVDLGQWLSRQRRLQRAGKLTTDRARLLEEIGIRWDVATSALEAHLSQLRAFRAQHGHVRVPDSDGHEPHRQLARWIEFVRRRWEQGRLTPERIARLREAEFPETAADARFSYYCHILGNVARTLNGKPYPASAPGGAYLKKLRKMYTAGTLPPTWKAKINELEGLGIRFGRRAQNADAAERGEADWKAHADALRTWIAEGNDPAVVPPDLRVGELRLGRWVQGQQRLSRVDRLDDIQIATLKDLGVLLPRGAAEWRARFEALKAYRDAHGHQRFTRSGEGRGLPQWVARMQAQRRSSSLPDSWIQQLDAIGFQWTADDERWEYFLAVQTKDLKGRAARAYLHRLEQAFLTGTLPEARRLALEQLGVPWASGDAARAHMVRRLELLAKKVGEKGVRANLSLDRELKDWVRAQRDRVASGQLDPALLTPLERRVLASGSAAAKPARTATNVPRSRGRAHR